MVRAVSPHWSWYREYKGVGALDAARRAARIDASRTTGAVRFAVRRGAVA
jgi:hypothetical protein